MTALRAELIDAFARRNFRFCGQVSIDIISCNILHICCNIPLLGERFDHNCQNIVYI